MKSFLVSLLFFILAVASLDQAGAFVVTGRSMLPRTLSLAAEAEESSSEAAVAPKEPKPEVKCPDCDLCDGSGRILGGIGVVLPWWPIKAYRPCPNFLDRGGLYQRSGQGLDEIAFGRDSTYEG